MTDILCVNESEAQIILGREEPIETENDIEEAMKRLLKKCQTIIITLGKFSYVSVFIRSLVFFCHLQVKKEPLLLLEVNQLQHG